MIELPENVKKILKLLQENGYEAYAVGGCIRDALLGRVPQDWDITTSALPGQVKELFSHTVDTGIQHGTVTVLLGQSAYEVTTYRLDGEYEDARHPKEVTFTSNLLEDLKRRDFTMNAMAYNEKNGLIDAFGGVQDLKDRIIRCVGNPMERFTEDALRMLRAVRFAAQLGFRIESGTKEAVVKLAGRISKISVERIRTELVKLLLSEHPGEIRTVYELGLSRMFLPELDAMMKEEQHSPHHSYTVGEHTIKSIEAIRPDKTLRLTMLLHDVAKPECRTTDLNGRDHFYGHPKRGAERAQKILRRLKFDNETITEVCQLIAIHDDRPSLNPVSIRRTINRNGPAPYPALFEVKLADTLAQSTYYREEKIAYIQEYKRLYEQVLQEHQCIQMEELCISGNDLIAMGMKPGKELGMLKKKLLDAVLEHPEWNEKEKLLGLAHKMMSPFI